MSARPERRPCGEIVVGEERGAGRRPRCGVAPAGIAQNRAGQIGAALRPRGVECAPWREAVAGAFGDQHVGRVDRRSSPSTAYTRPGRSRTGHDRGVEQGRRERRPPRSRSPRRRGARGPRRAPAPRTRRRRPLRRGRRRRWRPRRRSRAACRRPPSSRSSSQPASRTAAARRLPGAWRRRGRRPWRARARGRAGGPSGGAQPARACRACPRVSCPLGQRCNGAGQSAWTSGQTDRIDTPAVPGAP